jgi:hypothetical protein
MSALYYSGIGLGDKTLEPIWTAADGKQYFISEMSNTHIKHCVNSLRSQQATFEVQIWRLIFAVALQLRKVA